jgi:putative ABC transport system permease protein
VIGETVRREMFGGTVGQTGLGAQIRIKQFSCQVVGIEVSKGQIGGGDQDNSIVVPLKTYLRRVAGDSHIGLIIIAMKEGVDTTAIKASLTQLMRERRKLGDLDNGGLEDNFNIFDTQQLANTLTTMGLLTSLLGAVAAVSLLVGGIGIMNIMLVSVTERTREIGLRLAVGALESEVLLQFLIEAVVLSAIGGLIGIALATGASWGLSILMGLPYAFDPIINAVALLFSGFIGVVFGYFPARRAARLDPIEALRHE